VRSIVTRLKRFLVHTWPGRFVVIAIPVFVGVLLDFSINRLANAHLDEILHQPEFYAMLALVLSIVAATFIGQLQSVGDEAQRRSRIGFAKIHETRNFTGRKDELANIESALHLNPPAVVICGLRGIGKSALAREYANRNRDHFEIAWWLAAKSEDGIINGFLELGASLGSGSEVAMDGRAGAERVRDSLTDLRKPVLLVFDDLDDEALLYWKPERGVRILATSNKVGTAWHADIVTIPLGLWSLDEATEYLQHECRPRSLSPDDAAGIARTLDHLPLALSHAGAYLRQTRRATVNSYLKHIMSHLEEVPPDVEYPKAVFAAFRESVARAEVEAPGAAAVLSLASFFSPDAIPEALFQQASEVYPEGLRPQLRQIDNRLTRDLRTTLLDSRGFEKALGTLNRLSLIEEYSEARAFAMHPMVQMVARTLMGDAASSWAQAAVSAVLAAFPEEKSSTLGTRERLLPHARAALDALPISAFFPPAGLLAFSCGNYLSTQGDLIEAERLHRQGLAIFEAFYGPDHPIAASSLNNLAHIYSNTNRLDEAELLYCRALKIDEAFYGPNHPMVAQVLNDFADLLGKTNRHVEAERLHRRALAIREASNGPDHPVVAQSLNNLANLLLDTDRFAEADLLHRRALAIREASSYGPDHPEDVAASLNNLALVLIKTSRLAEAESLFRRALAMLEAIYGPEHPEVARSLENLANLLGDTNRFAEAEQLHRRALMIREARYGPEHPEVASSLVRVANLLGLAKRFIEAERLYRRAVSIYEASYGPNHPELALCLNNFAVLFEGTNRFAEAERLHRRALAIREANYGPEHSEVAQSLHNLAAVLGDTNQVAEAELLFRRALAIYEAIHGSDHLVIATNLNNLAVLLRRTKRFAEAEPLSHRAATILSKSSG
jgi:tetratricopeptide (TPR) repeat protein